MEAKRVAVYIRVASKDDFAMEVQREALLKVALDNDFERNCIEFFEDNGYSGTSLERPALCEMLNSLDNQTVVLAKNPDRIARRTADMYELIRQIRNKGAELYVAPFGKMEQVDTTLVPDLFA